MLNAWTHWTFTSRWSHVKIFIYVTFGLLATNYQNQSNFFFFRLQNYTRNKLRMFLTSLFVVWELIKYLLK